MALMSEVIDRAEAAYFWVPDADKSNEGQYHEVGKDWLKKLIGKHNEQRVDFSFDDGRVLYVHGGNY